MATYDLEEQEKIAELKSWWDSYGTLVIVLMAVFIAAVAGRQAWNYYQKQQADQAAELYAALQETAAAAGGDPKKIGDAANLLTDGYAGSGYAPRAALIAARASFEAGDLQNARLRLQWVVDNAKEAELKDLAQLRLAGLLLDQKKYDEALRVLEGRHSEPFDGLYADLKGDIQTAAGRTAEARAAYQTALAKLGGKNGYRNIVQMKLDALGEAQ